MAPAGNPHQDLRTQVDHVRDDLRREFAWLPDGVVEDRVRRVEEELADAPVRAFVPVLVRRGAREDLRRLPRP